MDRLVKPERRDANNKKLWRKTDWLSSQKDPEIAQPEQRQQRRHPKKQTERSGGKDGDSFLFIMATHAAHKQ